MLNPNDETLVVVFLRGGADTVNLLIPLGDSDYLKHRPTLGFRPHQALELTDFYHLHPAMAPLLPAWHARELAFVQAVGLDDSSGSHFEMQDRLEEGAGLGQTLNGGWAGRALRLLQAGPMAGLALGDHSPKSLRGAPSIACFTALSELSLPRAPVAGGMAAALKVLYRDDTSVLGARALDTVTTVERLSTLSDAHRPPVDYPSGTFGRSLADLATLLRAKVGVRLATVDLSNWDTHFVQPAIFAGLVGQLAQGLAAFRADLGEVRSQVKVIVVTEFGRRLYENASGGTDHGRGFTALVLGNVVGGQVHGDWPGFEADALPGPGGLRVKIDVRVLLRDAVVATLGPQASAVFPGVDAVPLGVFIS